MKTRGERLRYLREKAGWSSAKAAAEHFGLKVSTYNAHERAGQPGGRDFDETAAIRYARWYNADVLWILYGDKAKGYRFDPNAAGGHGAVEPDLPPAFDSEPFSHDESMTVGSETGRRGIPDDASAQLDVTAGMGGGGLTIISEGIPGRSGMTFAAEHVRDFWRLPGEVLAALSLKARDVIIVPVQGDSMADTLIEGDYVFVDTRHRLPSPDGIYCLGDEFGGLIVKRLEVVERIDDDVRVRVISDNPRHPSKPRMLSELRIVGRVLRRFGIVG